MVQLYLFSDELQRLPRVAHARQDEYLLLSKTLLLADLKGSLFRLKNSKFGNLK